MPRAPPPNSCLTCRRRKLKCDENLPVCRRCDKGGIPCDRSSRLKIRHYRSQSGTVASESENRAIDPLAVQELPRRLLQHPEIARLFHMYIKELAPWYDLNDRSLSFAQDVPRAALCDSLLFAAIIALAGIYASRKYYTSAKVSDAYHDRCLKLLILLTPEDTAVRDGTALAATCLLRSYEILTESDDPNRHLFGASTLISSTTNSARQSLLASGFWNYLREDITYSLIYDCPLKVEVNLPGQLPKTDDEHANNITLILANLINLFHANDNIDDSSAVQALKFWDSNFHATPFSRCETDSFPTVRMLNDSQAAALHYYHVSRCIVEPQIRISLALEICGLAMSSESDAVVVNSYGPICFAGRWLPEDIQRQELIRWLQGTQKKTAWSVEVLLKKLRNSWYEVGSENAICHRP